MELLSVMPLKDVYTSVVDQLFSHIEEDQKKSNFITLQKVYNITEKIRVEFSIRSRSRNYGDTRTHIVLHYKFSEDTYYEIFYYEKLLGVNIHIATDISEYQLIWFDQFETINTYHTKNIHHMITAAYEYLKSNKTEL